MGLTKYAIYIGIILIVALLFQQIMTFLYDLTLQGVAGQANAYIFLCVIWVLLYLLARLVLDKKVHPKSSKYALWGGILHIGIILAAYFAQSNPLMLLIFPIIIGIVYWTRQKRPHASKFGLRLQPTHPLFIDTRGGIGVLRIGHEGFLLLKFFQVQVPLPIREVLLFFYHEQIECTFEVRGGTKGPAYYFGILMRGRRYDAVHQQCLEQANKVRQFLKKIRVRFTEISDHLNLLTLFYAPYFLYTPTNLTKKGSPQHFPTLSTSGNEIIVENELEDCSFTIHKLTPTFVKNLDLFPFLEGMTERFCLQFHLTPLSPAQVDAKEEQLNADYSTTLKRLTTGLENNTEFQAASYLFTQMESSKENLEPLLDQRELDHFKELKRRLHQVKEGRTIGLWETEFHLVGSTSLAQALSVKIGGSTQPLSPYNLPPFSCRTKLGDPLLIESRDLSVLLPNQKAVPVEPTIEEGGD